MAYLLIVYTLYWFCGVFIYGSATSSHCGFNAFLGNASMLNNVGFNGSPTVYTVGIIIVRGIIYYIECLSCIRQWHGGMDGDVWSVCLNKRVRQSHKLPPPPPQALWLSLRSPRGKGLLFFFFFQTCLLGFLSTFNA